jgi:hypothetical protein
MFHVERYCDLRQHWPLGFFKLVTLFTRNPSGGRICL